MPKGGARKGAGRKKLALGSKVSSSTINLYPDEWEAIDRLRGDLTRSKWLRQVLQDAGYLPPRPGQSE